MNVLITTGIFPPDIGGPATYVPQIAKGLTERGHRITVLTLTSESVESVESEESIKSIESIESIESQETMPAFLPRPRRGRGKGEGDRPDSGYPFRLVRIPRRLFKPWRWIRTIFTIVWLGRNSYVLFVNGLAMESVLANLLLRKPMVRRRLGISPGSAPLAKAGPIPTSNASNPEATRHTPCAMRFR
jgi:hypothetical protein